MNQGTEAHQPDSAEPLRPATWSAAFELLGAAGRAPWLAPLGFAVLQGLLPLAGLWAMRLLVDAVAAGLRGDLPAPAAWSAVGTATALAAAVAIAGSVLRALSSYRGERLGRDLTDAIAGRLLQHSAAVELAAFDDPGFHRSLQLAQEQGSRPVRLAQDLAALGAALVAGLAMALVLASTDPWLPLWVGGAAVPVAWARRHEARARFRFQQRQVPLQRELGVRSAFLLGQPAAREVRALRLGTAFLTRIAALRAGIQHDLRSLLRGRAWRELAAALGASAALFGAYLLLGHAALHGALSLGGLLLHAQACQRIQNAVRDLVGASSAVAEDRLFLQPLVAFLQQERRMATAAPAAEVPVGPWQIELVDLGFRYGSRPTPVFAGLAWTLPPGSRWALLGANGTGKSTLLALLLRLYDPTTGAILVNGVPLRRLSPERWRAPVGVLLQGSRLLELPLQEQLAFGRDTLFDAARLWALLDALQLAERVRTLPLGLATVPSARVPGGVVFSPGEERRLLLARALLHEGPLLLLDEPFAGLDAAASAALVALLQSRPAGQTVVVADHRPEVLAACSHAARLAAGRLWVGSATELGRDWGVPQQG